MKRYTLFFLILFLSLAHPNLHAQSDESARLDVIIRDLKTIELQQTRTLNDLDLVLSEIKNLKIWAKRR